MSNNLIAIVGRPNVGKSTFFNRLLKQRKAIVGSEEGITRDRIYGEIDWSGHILTFIDTGGYIPDDVDVFNQVMSAYGMPKETDEQKQKRTESIQLALKDATDVPLACAKLCREVIDLCESAAEKGNANVVSDAGVALLAGYAGLRSAALNVYINIGGIKDEAFANDRRQQLESLLDGIEIHKEDVYELVKSKL